MNLNQITLPAVNIADSVAFYRTMGFEQIVDSPHYARFKATQGDASFSLHEVADIKPPTQVVVYFESASAAQLDAQVAQLQARGLVFSQLPRDEPWLWREARLQDPAANVICLYYAGENRLDPPWRITTAIDQKLTNF